MKHLSDNDFNQNRLANVPDGTAPQEAVNRQQLDTKITGVGVKRIIVSDEPPAEPQAEDLWLDENEADAAERYDVGNVLVTGVGTYTVTLDFVPSVVEFDVLYRRGVSAARASGYYNSMTDSSFSMYDANHNAAAEGATGASYTSPIALNIVASDGSSLSGLDGTVTVTATGFDINVTTKNGASNYQIIWKAKG